MRVFSAFAALAILASCGNDPDRSDPFRLLAAPGETAVAQDPLAMARIGLAEVEGPLMLAVLEARGAVALMVPYGQNGPVRTWVTADRRTVSLVGGRIVATRGLGHDLMARAPATGFRPGPSQALLSTLNAAHEPVEFALSCRVIAGERMPITLASGESMTAQGYAEKCVGPDGSVQNDFWLSDGQLRQSRQWLGPDAGYLTLQMLRP